MKKILSLSIILTIAFSVESIAATTITNHSSVTDTVRKKIVHPSVAMTDVQLTDILNAMRQKRSDDEKLTAIKENLKDKGITVDQLIKLLNQFLTDDAKLAGAEYAFPYTVNFKTYLKIMDLFSQEGYKYRLEDFYDKNRKL
jgi:uncharacterized membrane-anchored protein YjiN (DUF445 family)